MQAGHPLFSCKPAGQQDCEKDVFAAMGTDNCRQCWLQAELLKPQDDGMMNSKLQACRGARYSALLPASRFDWPSSQGQRAAPSNFAFTKLSL